MKLPIRSMIVAPPGKVLLAFDLSQAETWVVAYSANEASMKDALTNGDIHTNTAVALFDKAVLDISKEERYIGKRCNHALSYRMSPEMMAMVINKDARDSGVSVSLLQAKHYYNRWHERYRIKEWWSEIEGTLKSTRQLRTIYGRIRTFYAPIGDSLYKEATAYLPQSTVGDHALGAVQPELGIEGGLRTIHKRFHGNDGIQIVNTAHDSIMMEVPSNIANEIAPQVYRLFKRPMLINGEQFEIPVDGEIGDRWGELEKIPKDKLAA